MSTIICPKCGYEQTGTDECVKCGVIFSKYVESRKGTEFDQRTQLKRQKDSNLENPLQKIRKWVIRVAIFFIVGAFAVGYYFIWWIEHTHKVHSRTFRYIEIFTTHFQASIEFGDITCCTAWFDELHVKLKKLEELDIELKVQDLIPPEEIRHLGFLVAKNITIRNDGENVIIICKTPIETVRKEKGVPPKRHLAGYANGALRWLIPSEYRALDKSLYVDIEMLIQKYPEIRRNAEHS